MQEMRPTLILLNGNVYTLSRGDRPVTAGSSSDVQAIACLDEKIAAIGSNEEIRALGGALTRVIDLEGRTVLPGFVDCHTHLLGYGLSLAEVSLREAKSIAEAMSGVKAKVATLKPGEWLTGGRWDRNLWAEWRLPRKEDLDAVSPANPATLLSKDGHSAWVNSLALKLAGIIEETPDPAGGQIDRDPATGEPTGILRENAIRLVWDSVAEPTPERRAEVLKKAVDVANRKGLVGAHVCEGPKSFRAFQTLREKGELSLRVYMLLSQNGLPQARELGLRTGFGDDWLRIGPVKLFADGTLGAQTAALLEPYENAPENYGAIVTSREELTEIVRAASKDNIASATHAIGDAACRNALDAIGASRQAGYGLKLRHRLEHVQLIQPEDIQRIAQLGVIASVQPLHATSDRDLADKYWGQRCAGRAYAYRTLLDAGAHLVFGSDVPVETLDPLKIIYAAATRKREEEPERPAWYPDERLSIRQAVEAYTLGAAYASGEEQRKGSLEIGKLADLVVLSKDIFTALPEEILQTRVECTIVGGKVVYEVG